MILKVRYTGTSSVKPLYYAGCIIIRILHYTFTRVCVNDSVYSNIVLYSIYREKRDSEPLIKHEDECTSMMCLYFQIFPLESWKH